MAKRDEPKAYFYIPCPMCSKKDIRIEEGMRYVTCPDCNRRYQISIEIVLQEVDKELRPQGKATELGRPFPMPSNT